MTTPTWCARHRPGLVTGLRAEARIAQALGAVAAGGGSPAGATRAAERLVAEGATALVSFGLCGGLDPALRSGALVVPRVVLTGDQRLRADDAVSGMLGGYSAGALLAADDVVATQAAKRALFEAGGAVAVDLESGMVALVAARHGLPFAVLRAVCDPADTTLPPAALLALNPAGAIGAWRVAASVLAVPGQLPALLRLARDAARARAALVRRVRDIGGRGRPVP